MANKEWRRFIKFALVGGMNTGIDLAIFSALVYLAGMSTLLAQCISYFMAFLNSYWFNRRWTFQVEKRSSTGELVRFGLVNLLSFLFATGILLAVEKGFQLTPIVAKLISVVASLAVNYTGSKLWVFREEKQHQGQ